MNYRHSVYFESTDYLKLATLAADAGAILADLRRVPNVHFFKEDPSGRYPRAARCAGFIDYRTDAQNLDIFVRGGMSAAETVKTIFHECQHIQQFSTKLPRQMSHDERESQAEALALLAPESSSYQAVYAEIARKLTKWCVHKRDYTRAKQYHHELTSVDPKAAEALANDVLTPRERRLKTTIEAERIRRETERKVLVAAKAREFKEWCADQERKRASWR